ncbi:MAG: hypothetical protein K2M81_03265, partial [Lachnospiraceae bacterium]|nr:hypothetical protein [Lachnospiraceae bacterium]
MNRRSGGARRTVRPAAAFLLTLCVVLSVGIAGMMLARSLIAEAGDENGPGIMGQVNFWVASEKIPQEPEEEIAE